MPYQYNADEYCDSCGQLIKDDCDEKGQEDTGDSNEYPQWVSEDDESDCPRHCGSGSECEEATTLSNGHKIGALLGTTLTTDGVEYVQQAIYEALQECGGEDIAHSGSVALEVWAVEFADYDVWEELDWSEVFDAMSETLSEQKNSSQLLCDLHNQVCSRKIIPCGEEDFVYCEAESGKKPDYEAERKAAEMKLCELIVQLEEGKQQPYYDAIMALRR